MGRQDLEGARGREEWWTWCYLPKHAAARRSDVRGARALRAPIVRQDCRPQRLEQARCSALSGRLVACGDGLNQRGVQIDLPQGERAIPQFGTHGELESSAQVVVDLGEQFIAAAGEHRAMKGTV